MATPVYAGGNDKENCLDYPIITQSKADPEMSGIADISPRPRTPLSAINDPSNIPRSSKSLRRARYSSITPISTPLNHKENYKLTLKSVGDVSHLLSLGPGGGTPSRAMPLNALIYKKVLHIIEDLRKDHEKELAVKNSCIEILQHQLKSVTEEPQSVAKSEEVLLREKVSEFVQNIILTASCRLVQESISSSTSEAKINTATSPINTHMTSCDLCSRSAMKGSDWLIPPLKIIFTEGEPILEPSDLNLTKNLTLDDQERCLRTDKAVEPNTMSESDSILDSSHMSLSSSYSEEKTDGHLHHIGRKSVGTLPITTRSQACMATMVTPLKQHDVAVMTNRVKFRTTQTSPIVILKSRDEQELHVQKLEAEKAQTCRDLEDSRRRVSELEGQLMVFNNIKEMFPLIKESQTKVQSMLSLGFQELTKLLKNTEVQLPVVQEQRHCLKDEDLDKTTVEKLQETITKQKNIINGLQNINKEYKSEILSRDRQLMTLRGQNFQAELKINEEKVKLKQFAELLEKNSECAQKKQALFKDSQEEAEKLQQAFKETTERLKTALCQVSELEQTLSDQEISLKKSQEEAEKLQQVYRETRERLESAIHQVSELQQSSSDEKIRLSGLEKDLSELESLRDDLSHRLEQTTEEFEDFKKKSEDETESLELEKINLFRTLENCEKDLDTVTLERDRMAKLVGHQKTVIESLKRDIIQGKLIKEQMNEVEHHMAVMQQSSKETQEFFEEERKLMEEELSVKENLIKRLKADYAKLQAENTSLGNTVQSLNARYKELSTDLDETKAEAHYLLLQQNTEITQSMVSLHSLLDALCHFQGELTQYVYQETVKIIKDEHRAVSETTTKCTLQQSFIGSVLNSVQDEEKVETPTKNDDLLDADKQNENNSSKPVIGTKNSAFVRIQPSPKGDLEEANENPDTSPHADQMEPLIHDVGSTFEKIISTFLNLYHLLKQKESDLSQQIQSQDMELRFQAEANSNELKSLKKQLSVLEEEIKQAFLHEKSLQDALKHANDKLSRKDLELQEAQGLILERTERMESLADQLRSVRKHDQELSNMTSRCQEKDAELAAIKKTLAAYLREFEEKHGPVAAMGLREQVQLRKEISLLQSENAKLQEGKDAVFQKFAKHVEVYKANWNKAEQEVARLDNLVDRITEAAAHHKETMRGCSKLKPLLQELGI